MPGLLAADSYYFGENAASPLEKRDPEEKAEVYLNYQRIVLAKVGIEATKEHLSNIMRRAHQLSAGMTFVLFDDVIPTLTELKEDNITLGLLTNATKNMISIYRKLGLEPYIDFVVTSEEAGADKPLPPIFLIALERAGVDASEAMHVGDQYNLDIVGARGVGIAPILIDRHDLYPDINDCPRIKGLAELVQHL